MKICVGVVEGDANVWKKLGIISQSRKNRSWEPPPSGRPKRSWLHKVYVIACMQLRQTVQTCGQLSKTWPATSLTADRDVGDNGVGTAGVGDRDG